MGFAILTKIKTHTEKMTSKEREYLSETLDAVYWHFQYEPKKALLWFFTPNPIMGGVMPCELMLYRPAKARKIVFSMLDRVVVTESGMESAE